MPCDETSEKANYLDSKYSFYKTASTMTNTNRWKLLRCSTSRRPAVPRLRRSVSLINYHHSKQTALQTSPDVARLTLIAEK